MPAAFKIERRDARPGDTFVILCATREEAQAEFVRQTALFRRAVEDGHAAEVASLTLRDAYTLTLVSCVTAKSVRRDSLRYAKNRANAEMIACPRCSAAVNTACVTDGYTKHGYHTTRWIKANDALRKAQAPSFFHVGIRRKR